MPLLPRPAMRSLATKALALGLALGATLGTAHAHDLGELGPALARGPAPGWQARDDGLTVHFSNEASDSPQMLLWQAGRAPAQGRSSLVEFTMESTDPQASFSFLVGNMDSGETCLLFVTSKREAGLDCIQNGQTSNLAYVQNAVTQAQNTIQVIEKGDTLYFLLNKVEIAQMQGRSAQGDGMGVLAMGRGDFAIHHFSTYVPEVQPTASQAPTQQPPATQAPPSQPPVTQGPQDGAQLIDQAFASPLRQGWRATSGPKGWLLSNKSQARDDQTLPLALPKIGTQTRVIALDVTLAPPPEGLWSARASAGLMWENPETGHSCALLATAEGDAVLVCFTPSGRAIEMGRAKSAASGEGPHILSVIETATSLRAVIGTQDFALIENHPSLGGNFSLYAYERGTFGFPQIVTQDIASAPVQKPPETRRPEVSMGEGLGGPLPLFGNDKDRAGAAYLGIARSIFLHELGHALIGELAVPSTGPEEDAVDIYSALQMADAAVTPSGDETLDRLAPQAAGYAALSWYYSGRLSEAQGAGGANWQDEHTADLKRFRNMFCVIYGANPSGFGPLAQAVKMEERTLARCEEEFRKQNRAWRAILAPYARIGPDTPEGHLPANAQGAGVEVEIRPSRRQVGEYLRQNFGDQLRASAEAVGRTFALPRPLKVIYQDCDVVNAWYAPAEGSITMCYEIVEHFAVLISDIEEGTKEGYTQVASSDPQAGRGSPQGQAPTGQMAFDELADAGVPQTLRLFPAPYRGATPNGNPKAWVVTTAELSQLMQGGSLTILDVREGAGLESIPGAIQVAGLGADGSLSDSLQGRVKTLAQQLTEGDAERPIILMGSGPEDRAAYNAALRIGTAGFKALWYRGGLAAWAANGLPLAPLE